MQIPCTTLQFMYNIYTLPLSLHSFPRQTHWVEAAHNLCVCRKRECRQRRTDKRIGRIGGYSLRRDFFLVFFLVFILFFLCVFSFRSLFSLRIIINTKSPYAFENLLLNLRASAGTNKIIINVPELAAAVFEFK